MAISELLLKSQGNVDIQPGGPGNNWQYLSACAAMSGPTVSFGGIETRWCQDPNNAGKFIRSVRFRTAPDDITFDVTSKLSATDKIKQLLCPFGLRARFLTCAGQRNDPSQYKPIMLGYTPVELESKSYEDLAITDEADNDEIMVTTPANAAYEYMVEKMTAPTRLGSLADFGAVAFKSVQICSDAQCSGSCGAKKDGCDTIYALTDNTTGIYATPNLVIGTKNLTTGVWTWTSKEITGLAGEDADAIRCAGSRILVVSNAGSDVAYSDDTGDTWTSVALAAAPATGPNSLFVRTAREIWVSANGGYLFKSIDGGLTYTTILDGTITTENLNSVYAYDENIIWVVGDNGILLKSENGGTTWSNKTTTLGLTTVNLLDIRVPSLRAAEAYIATNDGRVFRTIDEGVTYSAISFSGSGVGSVDKLLFAGPYAGEVMFILHTDASNRTRLLRDNSGGAGGSDVELVYNWSDVITAGVELDDMTVCDINQVYMVGVNESGYPTMIDAA